MVLTRGGVAEPAFRVEGRTHFAISAKGTVATIGTNEVRSRDNGLMTDWSVLMDGEEQIRIEIAPKAVSKKRVERALGRVDHEDVPIQLEAPRRPDTTVNASAGWTVVIWQTVVGVTSCVHAYNYRNNSTDYFRAYSLSVNEDICYRVRASLWASPHTFGGACQAPFKASSGPAVNYASQSATFAPAQSAPDNFVCSNHSAWTPDWLQVLNSVGHDAKISG